MVRRRTEEMSVPSESVEQINLFRWASYNLAAHPELELLYHIPNGGHRNISTAKRLKLEGVKAGVPDINLPIPRGGFHGLYIELKRLKGNTTTIEQDHWLDKLEKNGYKTIVCYGWEQAAKVIESYLSLSREGM